AIAASATIDKFYSTDGKFTGATWAGANGFVNPVASKVTFSDGNGNIVKNPSDPGAFPIAKNNPDFSAMLAKGPVMIRDSTIKSTTGVSEGHWMLATQVADGGKSIVANDPLSGQQVKLDYTKGQIGKVSSILDPQTNRWISVNGLSATQRASLEKDVGSAT